MSLFFSVIVLKEPDKITLLPHATEDPHPIRNRNGLMYDAHGHTSIMISHNLLWLWRLPSHADFAIDLEFLPKNKIGSALFRKPSHVLPEELEYPVKYWKLHPREGRKRSDMNAPWWRGQKIKKLAMELTERMLAPDYQPPGPYAWPKTLLPKTWEYSSYQNEQHQEMSLCGGVEFAAIVPMPGQKCIVTRQHTCGTEWRQIMFNQETKQWHTLSSPRYLKDVDRYYQMSSYGEGHVVDVPPPILNGNILLPAQEL